MEHGEYVDLEKLIPWDTLNESRLEWVHKDAATFLAPMSNKDTKISNVKRWDQAFRIYATFNCGANPNRAKEIWQYVDVIHTATTAYCWENVYNYDVTFRHLMEFNPSRSWAVTYSHMWNLSLREPLTKNWFNKSNQWSGSSAGSNQWGGNRSANSYKQSHNQQSNQSQKHPHTKKKSRYCWNFNKGEVCKFGKSCKFIERCSYCNSPGHPLCDCVKSKAKNANMVSLGAQISAASSSSSNSVAEK